MNRCQGRGCRHADDSAANNISGSQTSGCCQQNHGSNNNRRSGRGWRHRRNRPAEQCPAGCAHGRSSNRQMIALAGNPNCGKTTLFNALTGAHQHVGNYPGVTVEKKSGRFHFEDGLTVELVDLPGTYSLSAYSPEEIVAADFLLKEKPAAVISVVDASNLERNLYLTLLLLEMGQNVIIALNMVDQAVKRGFNVDSQRLAQLLGVPVMPIVARNAEGLDELMTAVRASIDAEAAYPEISYGADIDEAVDFILEAITAEKCCEPAGRWLALEHIGNARSRLDNLLSNEALATINARIDHLRQHVLKTQATTPEALITDHRYGYIKALVRQNVIIQTENVDRMYLSDRIDQVLTHRTLGPLIMLAVIYGLYQLTFGLSAAPVGWLESAFGALKTLVEANMQEGVLRSMITAGIIDGVGGVLGFVPLILFMFLGIAFLEDSGYLARMAYMLDRIFRVFGLHGSSVMPFIVSGGIAGGCAVPGVMATRTIKSRKERLATMLTVPFMNCGAKLPVFALLIAAFFSRRQGLMLFIITLLSWLGALVVAWLLRQTVLKGPASPFVLELPPYRLPTIKGLLIHTGERAWHYIKKAGTVILGISIVLWAMMTYPGLPEQELAGFAQQRSQIAASDSAALARIDGLQAEAALKNSLAGRIGTALTPVSHLAGFDWRANIALVGGFAAKEVIVSTLGTAYALGNADPEASASLAGSLSASMTPLMGLTLIIFVMYYAPCFVTLVCIQREAGSKWALFALVFSTLFAFALATLTFQIGRLLGF
ncbi:MAG: Ferrous iron transport protein B [Deltaproteobacteria bacterium ADurb.Bin510]|nr:MAG: Ferrous iron transport protein B [Deltaproteobacteria bacterium ADurb.Bin510]